MILPVSYNLRNLAVRRTTTAMTALGIGLTVAVLAASFALVDGLRLALEASGHPLNVLVTRKGSESELASNFERRVFDDLKFKPGIARNAAGEPLASREVVTVINLVSVEFPEGAHV
ncbi:MAG: ABC transporter permease, partial [Bryobacteraceae bacterium]